MIPVGKQMEYGNSDSELTSLGGEDDTEGGYRPGFFEVVDSLLHVTCLK